MSLALAILLLGLGLALIVAEVLFPSFGVLSLLASVALIASLATAFGIDTSTGVNFLIAVALLVPTAIMGGMKLFPHSPVGRRMVAGGLSFEARAATDERDLELVGATGEVETDLRPAGTARLDDRRVDVVSRGELIEAGENIQVIEVSGNRVVVARVEPSRSKDPQ